VDGFSSPYIIMKVEYKIKLVRYRKPHCTTLKYTVGDPEVLDHINYDNLNLEISFKVLLNLKQGHFMTIMHC